MCRQVIGYCLAVGWDFAVDDELLELLLDPANLRTRREASQPHDLLAGDERGEARRLLSAHGVEPGLQLVELFRFGIRRRGDVGPRQGHEAFEERPRVTH